VREPKWDLWFGDATRKCSRASREPERATLGARMPCQCMLRLTLPCAAQVAQAVLTHAQECSPSAQVKAAAVHVQTLKRNQGGKS
jgi:hypothetical protein